MINRLSALSGIVFVVAVSGCGGGGASSAKSKQPAALADDPGSCTPASKPTITSFGHCTFKFGDLGNTCTQATGSNGSDEAHAKKVCANVKGTFAPGPCDPSPSGMCLARCGTPNESLDTIYFGAPADYKKACDARKGRDGMPGGATYIAP